MENYFLLENYVTSEREPFLRMFLYYQPLPITRYQVRFYANNCFENSPIVSTAFKRFWGVFNKKVLMNVSRTMKRWNIREYLINQSTKVHNIN